MKTAQDMGMTNGDYVFINFLAEFGHIQDPIWLLNAPVNMSDAEIEVRKAAFLPLKKVGLLKFD